MKLHQSTVSSSGSVCCDVDGTLVEVIKRLEEASDYKAYSPQQGICNVVQTAEKSARGRFSSATGAADKSSGVVPERATGTEDLSGPEALLLRTASRDVYADTPSIRARLSDVSPAASMSISAEVHDPSDHLECGA